ncbi:MAG: hypothetical protein MJ127_00235 [Mogibacterium sp.]|nr:hypothetical protein [Mogibacterium sp.]
MKKYLEVKDIQNIITEDGTAHLTYDAVEMNDIIHPYSVPGYESLSGRFVGFLERFRPVIPKKTPIVLEIAGKDFSKEEKDIIDKAIWMHYGLDLSEAAGNLKKMRVRMLIYAVMVILSSSLLFVASHISNEVVENYAYILFWFFGYRILTHLVLDYQPIYRDYQWYRRLAALKLCFADENEELPDVESIARETSRYADEADLLTKNERFVEHVLMDGSSVSLGCRIDHAEDVLRPSGAGDLEIVSDEMADYLMSAVPFIKQKPVIGLTVEAGRISESKQTRISSAIRNYLAFLISAQDDERESNKAVSITFAVGLIISTLVLYIFGSNAGLATHEFILVAFWFFADYLLEFTILTRAEIKNQKKALEKLANMDISFEDYMTDSTKVSGNIEME